MTMNLQSKLKFLAAPVLALTCMSASAAEEVELTVVGTVVPAACEPTFTGGGHVNLGTIASAALSPTVFTVLQPQTIGFAITCTAPVAAGFTLADNRASAGAPVGIHHVLGRADEKSIYGFSTSAGQQVGAYALESDATFTADGATVNRIGKQFAGGTWGTPHDAPGLAVHTGIAGALGNYHGFAAPGTFVPIAFTMLSGNIVVRAALNKTSDLTVTNEVAIDGSTTLNIAYY